MSVSLNDQFVGNPQASIPPNPQNFSIPQAVAQVPVQQHAYPLNGQPSFKLKRHWTELLVGEPEVLNYPPQFQLNEVKHTRTRETLTDPNGGMSFLKRNQGQAYTTKQICQKMNVPPNKRLEFRRSINSFVARHEELPIAINRVEGRKRELQYRWKGPKDPIREVE
jgi:hypothetical protein